MRSNSIPVHLFNLSKHFSVQNHHRIPNTAHFHYHFFFHSLVLGPPTPIFIRFVRICLRRQQPTEECKCGRRRWRQGDAAAACCCCCCWSGAAAACCCCGWIEVEFTNWSSKQIRRNSQSCVSASSPNQSAPKCRAFACANL